MDITNRDKSSYPPRILEYRKSFKTSVELLKYYFLFLAGISVITIFKSQDIFGNIPIAGDLSPMASSKIQVHEDRMIITQGNAETVIHFSDIIKIDYMVNKHIGGCVRFALKGKCSFYFTPSLERSEYIIDAIYAYNPLTIPEEKYKKLHNYLVFIDHGHARYFVNSKKLAISPGLSFIIFPILLSFALYIKQINEFIIHSHIDQFFRLLILMPFFLTFIYCILYSFSEFAIQINISKKSKDLSKKRDLIFENKVYKFVLSSYLIICGLSMLAIFATDLNTLGMLRMTKQADYLGLSKGEKVWFDSRYNCINCKYSIRKGDIVYLDTSLAGRIIALPGEVVSSNLKDPKGRYLASTEEIIVPEESLAVLTLSGKVVKVVNQKNLRGKVSKNIPHFEKYFGSNTTSK